MCILGLSFGIFDWLLTEWGDFEILVIFVPKSGCVLCIHSAYLF